MAGLFAAAVIYVYPLFLPTPLLEPDEGLHATISQEMIDHGEWIVPSFRGEPFLDKPILYFWAQIISLKSFGSNEFAVRFPGLMFGLLGALTTGLLALRLFGRKVGLLSCLISMTMCIPLSLAQAAVHDVALVPFSNLALLCLWETERATVRRVQYQWLATAACMLALAILTKALIGIAIVGVAFGLFLIFSRTISIAGCVRLGAAFLIGGILASPWFIAMEFRIDGYLYYYFIERHVMGFATATQRHGQEPWFYYLPYLCAGSIPWIWYAIPMMRDEWIQRSQGSRMQPQMVFLFCWLLGGLFFLSTAKSKLVTYSLPLFPAIAILCAVAWQKFVSRGMSATSTAWFVSITRLAGASGLVVSFLVLAVCQIVLGTSWSYQAWILAAVLSAGSGYALKIFEQRRYDQTAALLSSWVAGMTLLVLCWPMQTIAVEHSERSLAQWLNRQEDVPEHLLIIGEKPSSLLFYLNADLRRQLDAGRVRSIHLNTLPTDSELPAGTVLAITQKKLVEAESGQYVIPGSYSETVGQFQLYRNENSPACLVQIATRSER